MGQSDFEKLKRTNIHNSVFLVFWRKTARIRKRTPHQRHGPRFSLSKLIFKGFSGSAITASSDIFVGLGRSWRMGTLRAQVPGLPRRLKMLPTLFSIPLSISIYSSLFALMRTRKIFKILSDQLTMELLKIMPRLGTSFSFTGPGTLPTWKFPLQNVIKCPFRVYSGKLPKLTTKEEFRGDFCLSFPIFWDSVFWRDPVTGKMRSLP